MARQEKRMEPQVEPAKVITANAQRALNAVINIIALHLTQAQVS